MCKQVLQNPWECPGSWSQHQNVLVCGNEHGLHATVSPGAVEAGAAKRRQQRGVDVEDAALEGAHQLHRYELQRNDQRNEKRAEGSLTTNTAIRAGRRTPAPRV